MEKTLLFAEYTRIIKNESKISNILYGHSIRLIDPEEVCGLVSQIQCIVDSGTVLRCCATRYNLTTDKIAYESVSAHTNLVQMIVDRVLAHEYGPYFDKTEDGFTYREIMETIRRHDLTENYTGDTPDDGARNEEEKLRAEHYYLHLFAENSPSRESDFEQKIRTLQYNMEQKIGFCGKLLYLADKVSAVLAVLGYDEKGMPPAISNDAQNLSLKDCLEMDICEDKISFNQEDKNGIYFKASEMWTIDYFRMRRLYVYDSTSLITAILIMYTLIVREKWYKWREEDYEKMSG